MNDIAATKYTGPTHVVIVNYNAGDWLRRSVKSALEHSEGPVTVVDNASADDSVLLTQTELGNTRLSWILNEDNRGFAAANNQVLSKQQAEFYVLLNPDCELHAETLQLILQAFSEYPRMGLASCRIEDEAGNIQKTCKRHFPTPRSALIRMLKLSAIWPQRFADFDYGDQLSKTAVEMVEAVSGAFMVVRTDAMREVGVLDEGYFMHCEDLDWCKRFALANWQVGFVQQARVTHAKGVSSKVRPIGVQWNLHRGMLRFFDKFYRRDSSWVLRGLVKLGIYANFALRAGLTLVGGRRT